MKKKPVVLNFDQIAISQFLIDFQRLYLCLP